MAFTLAQHQPATSDSKGPTPGAKALEAYRKAAWSGTTYMGIYNYRTVAKRKSLSLHAEGRALDIGIPLISGKVDAPKGMAVVDALGPHGRRLGIAQLIFNRTYWSARHPQGSPYTGKHPHNDHVHVSLTRQAGANLTVATLVAVIGGAQDLIAEREESAQDVAGPSLERVTHRVSRVTNSLNMRSQPSGSAAKMGELDLGAGVQQASDDIREVGGTSWMQIRAILGGSIEEGWVASKFLEPTGIALAKDESKGLERVTHRVRGVTNSLNMRTEPSVSAAKIGTVGLGAGVQQASDEIREVGGTSWMQIHAILGGSIEEGWVASKFLESVDA